MEAELTGLTEDGPVAWHGYDMNPIAVAKSKLILAMLEQDVPLDQILQIWFSTCISPEAASQLAVFCSALKCREENEDIRVLFDYWAKVSGTVDWMDLIQAWHRGRSDSSFTSIPMLLRERDRVEYARYVLRGQIFLGGSDSFTGNPTFLPPQHLSSSYLPPTNESVYCTFSGELHSENFMFASIEKRFLRNLANLRKHIKENQIKITLSAGTISADNKAVLSEIKGLKPAGIEWSNIPDYLTVQEFFSIARRCSVEGTRHSFHLMNWLNKVYGTNLVDYVPFHENYGRNFKLKGFFKDSSGALPKLVEELKAELISRGQRQNPSAITRDVQAVVSSMNFMDLSTAALSFRFCDTYMNFMFENTKLSRKEWKKSEMEVFVKVNSTVYASFEF